MVCGGDNTGVDDGMGHSDVLVMVCAVDSMWWWYGYHGIALVHSPCSRPSSSGTAMKLGQKHKDVDTFVTKLEEEGQSELGVGQVWGAE